MLYVVSKVAQNILDPGNLLLILLAIGLWRAAASRRGRSFGLIAFVLVAGAAS